MYKLLIIMSLLNCVFMEVSVVKEDNTYINGFLMTEFVSKHHYPIEVHNDLETEDGYLLKLHRMPVADGPPVLLVHGLMATGDCFVANGPDHGLGFVLNANGYDVWLFNARGTPHSRKHIKLDPDKDIEYWDFDWHEIGYYDIAASIDYIRNVTKNRKIYYIGHSQGSTVYGVLMSERPEYNRYIRLASLLAPSFIYGSVGLTLPEDLRLKAAEIIEDFRKTLGIGEVGPQLRDIFCSLGNDTPICKLSLIVPSISAGFSPWNIEWEKIHTLLDVFPVSAGIGQLCHYLQLYVSGEFQKYDYGEEKNLKIYNSKYPPLYNFKNLKAPVALYFGLLDWVASPVNLARYVTQLPNVALLHPLPYTHLDFIIAENVKTELYDKIISLMKKYRYS